MVLRCPAARRCPPRCRRSRDAGSVITQPRDVGIGQQAVGSGRKVPALVQVTATSTLPIGGWMVPSVTSSVAHHGQTFVPMVAVTVEPG